MDYIFYFIIFYFFSYARDYVFYFTNIDIVILETGIHIPHERFFK